MKALDKILTNDIPHHLTNTSVWGVPAYWMETQFKGDEDLEVVLEQFYVWIKFGFTAEEIASIDAFARSNPKMDTSDIMWGTWSYLSSALSIKVHRKLVLEIIERTDKKANSNRTPIL